MNTLPFELFSEIGKYLNYRHLVSLQLSSKNIYNYLSNHKIDRFLVILDNSSERQVFHNRIEYYGNKIELMPKLRNLLLRKPRLESRVHYYIEKNKTSKTKYYLMLDKDKDHYNFGSVTSRNVYS